MTITTSMWRSGQDIIIFIIFRLLCDVLRFLPSFYLAKTLMACASVMGRDIFRNQIFVVDLNFLLEYYFEIMFKKLLT